MRGSVHKTGEGWVQTQYTGCYCVNIHNTLGVTVRIYIIHWVLLYEYTQYRRGSRNFCRGGGGQRRPCTVGAFGTRADGGSRVDKHQIKVHFFFFAIVKKFVEKKNWWSRAGGVSRPPPPGSAPAVHWMLLYEYTQYTGCYCTNIHNTLDITLQIYTIHWMLLYEYTQYTGYYSTNIHNTLDVTV